MFNYLIVLFNRLTLTFFGLIYKLLKIETLEDVYHKEKATNNILMNKIKLDFNNNDDFNIAKNNLLNIIQDNTFLSKHNITTHSIINNNNNKFVVSFKNNCIYININHYYVSGPDNFRILHKVVNSNVPKFLKTNPFIGIIYLPLYLYKILSLKKKTYIKNDYQISDLIIEKNIKTANKRYYIYLSILQKIYKSLQMNRPMIAAFSVAFEDIPYINNNVGLIIIVYEITDTIEILKEKFKNEFYQAYVSNFILNCPLVRFLKTEIRDYIDCIVTSMYINTDLDFKIGWNCSKPTIEQMYAGAVSIIHSDDTINTNIVFNTCSKNYNYTEKYIDNFFE